MRPNTDSSPNQPVPPTCPFPRPGSRKDDGRGDRVLTCAGEIPRHWGCRRSPPRPCHGRGGRLRLRSLYHVPQAGVVRLARAGRSGRTLGLRRRVPGARRGPEEAKQSEDDVPRSKRPRGPATRPALSGSLNRDPPRTRPPPARRSGQAVAGLIGGRRARAEPKGRSGSKAGCRWGRGRRVRRQPPLPSVEAAAWGQADEAASASAPRCCQVPRPEVVGERRPRSQRAAPGCGQGPGATTEGDPVDGSRRRGTRFRTAGSRQAHTPPPRPPPAARAVRGLSRVRSLARRGGRGLRGFPPAARRGGRRGRVAKGPAQRPGGRPAAPEARLPQPVF